MSNFRIVLLGIGGGTGTCFIEGGSIQPLDFPVSLNQKFTFFKPTIYDYYFYLFIIICRHLCVISRFYNHPVKTCQIQQHGRLSVYRAYYHHSVKKSVIS